MATVNDLYTARFGYRNTMEVTRKYETPVHEDFAARKPLFFLLPLTTSEGATLDVRVDAKSAFSSLFYLMDFPYSPSYKNHTISKGQRGKPRVSVTLPRPGEIKKTPQYLQFVEDHKAWTEAKLKALRQAAADGMLAELLSTYPDSQEILDLTDDDARKYFEKRDWKIDPEVTFHNWRPCGWILTSGPDGYGHQTGLYAGMNWDTKTIVTTGWSSDD